MASELLRTLPLDATVFWVVVYKIGNDVSEKPAAFSQIIKNQVTNAPFRILSDPLLTTLPTIPRCVVCF
jgi:hypothetical protein